MDPLTIKSCSVTNAPCYTPAQTDVGVGVAMSFCGLGGVYGRNESVSIMLAPITEQVLSGVRIMDL